MILPTFPVGFGKNCFKSTGPETTPHHAGLISCHGEPPSQCHAGWKFDEKGNIQFLFSNFLNRSKWHSSELVPEVAQNHPSVGDSCLLVMAPSTVVRPTWAVLVTAATAVAPHGTQRARLSHMAKVEGSSIEGEVVALGFAEGDLFYMGVEPKIGVFTPKIIHLFIGVFHCKPSILGYHPYFLETPIFSI